MNNNDNNVITKDVFCASCGTKNDNKSNFCLNCGYELKKDLVKNNINNNQQSNVSFNGEDEDAKKKGFFRRGIISKVVGLVSVIYFVFISGLENGNYFLLLVSIVLGILYFKYPTMKKIINVILDVIGKLVLAWFIFMLILLGACFFMLLGLS